MNAHSLRVALRGRTLTQRQAGLCHDMVEDGFCSLQDVKAIFGERVASIVYIVTRRKNEETYDEFIDRICDFGDTDAVEVKLDDNADNIERCEGKHDGRKDLVFMYERYIPARVKLMNALKQRSPMIYEARQRANP